MQRTTLSRRGVLTGSLSTMGTLAATGLRLASAAEGEAPPADPTAGRQLVFDDQFERLDPAIWQGGPKATTGPSGFYGRSAFAEITGAEGFNPYRIIEDPLATDGHALQISAQYIGRTMNVRNYYGNSSPEFQWISGNLQTAGHNGIVTRGWRRGYFEARMRFPAHPLTWPAFWFLNKNSILRPQQSIELDVVEHKGWEPYGYGTYLHEWGKPDEHNEGTGVRSAEDLTAGYFRYGFLVEDATCTPYLERRPVRSGASGVAARWPLDRASQMDASGDVFWPLLTLALRTDVPFPDPLRPEDRLASMCVDYVQVYA